MNWSSLFSRFAPPRRRRRPSVAAEASVRARLQVESLEDRSVMAADPGVVIAQSGQLTPSAGTTALIGDAVQFDVVFQNTGSSVGYGPYIDLFLDTTGTDGVYNPSNPANPLSAYDGFNLASFQATYLGQPLPTVQFVTIQGSQFTHPLTHQLMNVPEYGTRFHDGDTIAVLQLPFGSFTAGQPPAPIHISVGTSNLADVDQPLAVAAVAGFQYGNDPNDNPGTDAPLPGPSPTGETADVADFAVTPKLWTVKKVYEGPEDETATGPNNKQFYHIDVDVATGQTIANLTVSDILSASMQYTGNNVTAVKQGNNALNLTAQPSINTAGGVLTNNFGTVVGVAGVDATLRFEFFVTRDNGVVGDTGVAGGVADGAPGSTVLTDPTSSVLHTNNTQAGGDWTPIDSRDLTSPLTHVSTSSLDPTNPDRGDQRHTLEEQSVATQKTVTLVDPNTLLPVAPGTPIIPGYTLLRYDIDFQVSDYVALQNLFLQDVLSDGQRLYVTAGTMPTLSVQNAYNTTTNSRLDSNSAAFGGAGTIDYQSWFNSNPGSDPTHPPSGGVYDITTIADPLLFTVPVTPTNPTGTPTVGSTLIQFNISQELIARGFVGGLLVGGNVNDGGSAARTGTSAVDPTSGLPYGSYFGGTRGHITFYVEVTNEFSDDYPSGDRSVDQLDTLSNSVPQIHAEKLDTTTISGAVPDVVVGVARDDTGTSVSIPIGDLVKTLYAVNGNLVVPGQAVTVQPGDLVTYRLTYTLPISSFENLSITDYLPLPVLPTPVTLTFDTTAPSPSTPTSPPPVNTISLGQDDTYFSTVNPFGQDVNVATTAPLSGTYNPAGDGSFVLTSNVIDGVSLADGARVLVKDQANANENGIYVFALAGLTLMRAGDFNSAAEVINSKLFKVLAGLVNGGQHFLQSNKLFTGFNIGGTSEEINFTQFAQSDATANSFTLNLGTYDDIPAGHRSSKVDLLVTLRVADAQFANDLFLTNQMRVHEGSTNAGDQHFDQIVQFEVVSPTVSIYKGIVGWENTNYNLGGITFTAPIDPLNPTVYTSSSFSGGPIDTSSEAAAIGAHDLPSAADAGDAIRFGVVLQNTGRGDAFDVTFSDVLPEQYQTPTTAASFASSTNLTVRRGDGTLLSGVLVDEYVRLASTGDLVLGGATAVSPGVFKLANDLLDGQNLKTGDRVLIKDQNNPAENGVYIVAIDNSQVGHPKAVLTRDGSAAVNSLNYRVSVMGGSPTAGNADQYFTLAAGGAWTAHTGTVPDYYFTYDVGTRAFTLNLTDAYDSGDMKDLPAPDVYTGGLSRGAAGGSPHTGFPTVPITNGSNTVVVTYDLKLDTSTGDHPASPDQPVVNTATVTNVGHSNGGTPGGGGAHDDATVTVKLPQVAKTLIDTSVDDPTHGNNLANQAAIGETVYYSVTVKIPEGKTLSAAVTDSLQAGLGFGQILSVNVSSGLTSSTGITSAGNSTGVDAAGHPIGGTNVSKVTVTPLSSNRVKFDFGDLLNADAVNSTAETIVITYSAVVQNVSGNQQGTTLANSAQFTWSRNTSPTTPDSLPGVQAGQNTDPTTGAVMGTAKTVQVVEPSVTTDKQVKNVTTGQGFAPTISADNNDTVLYQIKLTGSGATAFEVSLSDPLPDPLLFSTALAVVPVADPDAVGFTVGGTGSVKVNGTVVTSANVDTLLRPLFVITGNNFHTVTGADIDMEPGATITIVLRGVYKGSTGLKVDNTATAQWTSLNGDVTTPQIPGDLTSVERTGTGVGPNDYHSADTATIEGSPLVYKSIVATSEPNTSPANAAANVAAPGVLSVDGAIGEMVRYRLYVSIGEGVTRNFQIQDFLPDGMSFLNDGTARYGFISDGGLSSSTLSNAGGASIVGPGSATFFNTLASSSIQGVFGDGDISTSTAPLTGEGTIYASGADVFFHFGDLTNNDNNDTNNEFVVVEFNALVLNVTGNQSGTQLVNDFGVLVDTTIGGGGTPTLVTVVPDTNHDGTRNNGEAPDPTTPTHSNDAVVKVVEPNLSIDKKVVLTTTDASGTFVTYRVTLTNGNGANDADAYDVNVLDLLNPALTLSSGPSNYLRNGAAMLNTEFGSSGTTTINTTINKIAKGDVVSFDYSVKLAPLAEYPGTATVDNTATATFTSLPGAPGGTGDWTGTSDTSSHLPGTNPGDPGYPGSSTGERNGQDGPPTPGNPNNPLDNYSVSDTEKLGSLGDRVFFDANGDGIQNYVDLNSNGKLDRGEELEPGIAGVLVTLTYDPPGSDTPPFTITTTTGADGYYRFDGLPVGGTYKVSTPLSVSGMSISSALGADVDTSDALLYTVSTVLNAADPNRRDVDFGYKGTASIGDRVYIDANGDGVQAADGTEPNLPGVDVTLTWYGLDGKTGTGPLGEDYDLDNVVLTTKSGNPSNPLAPNYLFQYLPTGNFEVKVSKGPGGGGVPTDTTLTDSLDDSTLPGHKAPSAVENPTVVISAPGQAVDTVDFGYQGTASIGDTVWYDADGDGKQAFIDTNKNGVLDPGEVATEPGIGGVTVTLVFSGKDHKLGQTPGDADSLDDVVFTTVTDANGKYKFDGLPVWDSGSLYKVSVSTPANFPVQTYDSDGIGTANSSVLTLHAGEDNVDQDFGFRGNAQLGDFVWEDLDGNGRQDSGEPGLNGVTVDLMMAGQDGKFGTADDIVVLSTTTATVGGVPGKYLFDHLGAASYQVRFGTLPGYELTAKNSPVATGATNSDADQATARTDTIGVALGSKNFDVDAGLYRRQNIGDTVWYDVDNSGGATQGSGEPGIPNVKVTLDYAGLDGVFNTADDQLGVASTTTDSTGKYLFKDYIPGTYRVNVDPTTLPNGVTVPTYDLDGKGTANSAVLALVSGVNRLDADFSYTATGTLGDRVYVDADGDGVQDANGMEPSLPGVVVTLEWAGFDGKFGKGPLGEDYDLDNVTLTTTSTNPGSPLAPNYLFSNLASGNYKVSVSPVGGTLGVPDNMKLTDSLDDATKTKDASPQVTLSIGQNLANVDFGFQGTASIGDTVWFDQDDDGVQDFVDANGNGKLDPGETVTEPGIPNVPVTLVWGGADGIIGGANAADDVVFTTVTGADGKYTFQGLPVFGDGTLGKEGSPYKVTVAQPGNYPVQTYDKDGTGTANNSSLVLGPMENNVDQDFGYRGNLKLGDYVWLDVNGDGKQDASEQGLNNVKVTLTATIDGNTLTVVTTTSTKGGKDGFYEFDNLIQKDSKGNLVQYTVTVDPDTLPRTVDGSDADLLPDPLANTYDLDGNKNNQTTVTFAGGVDLDTLDFGYQGNGEIGDYVWLDVNGDGKQDPTEPGIANVQIVLTGDVDGDGVDETFTTTTGADGGYHFKGLPILSSAKDVDGNYKPIEYTVAVVQSTLPQDGNGDPIANTSDPDDATDPTPHNAIAKVTLSPSEPVNDDQDFGFVGPGSIGDKVFLDVDGSKAWNPGEGINGVKVTLTGDFDGDGIAESFTTTTKNDGTYDFPGLPVYDLNGKLVSYTVTLDPSTLPADASFTVDPDNSTPPDGVWTGTLPPAAPDRTDVDFGLQGKASLGDLIWIDADGDHTQNNGEAGITGVKVYLEADVNGDGTQEKFLATTTPTGYYQFVGLPTKDSKGNTIDYTVVVDQDTLPLDVANVSDPDENALIDAGKNATPPYTGDSVSHHVTFTDGNYSNQDQDFGYRLPGVIGDTIFLDVNNNGLPDPGEGLGGVKVSLTADLNGDGLLEIFNTTTDADGKYTFEGLPFRRRNPAAPGGFEPIVYTVTVDPDLSTFSTTTAPVSLTPGSAGSTLPAGVVNTTDPDGGTKGQSTTTISKEFPTDLAQDFGYRGPKGITGSVYIDLDHDGKRGDEPGIPGILVTLTYSVDDDGPGGQKLETVTTRTDADGRYSFTGLPQYQAGGKTPAVYIVTEGEQPPQYFDGLDQWRGIVQPGSDFRDPTQRDVLPPIIFGDDDPDVIVENNFGEYLIPEPAPAPPIPFPVTVLTVPRVQTPGYYPDEYQIKVPNDLERRSIRREEKEYASVEGAVFADLNNDGAFSPNEKGIGGVLIKLIGPSNRQAVTDADGRYSFDELPVGSYSILEVRPKGVLRGKLAVGSAGGGTSDNAFTDVGLSAGQRGTAYNFGELPPAKASGKAFLDRNRNGVQDPGEPGMPGVLMQVTGVDDRGATVNVGAFTGWDGAFSVEELRPGTYTVTELAPPMFRAGTATPGNSGGTAGPGTVTGVVLDPASSPSSMTFPLQVVETPQNAGAPLRWLWGALESPLRAFGLGRGAAEAPEKAAARNGGKTSDVRNVQEAGRLAAAAVESVELDSPFDKAVMSAVGLAGVLAVAGTGAARRSETRKASWEESVDRLFAHANEEN